MRSRTRPAAAEGGVPQPPLHPDDACQPLARHFRLHARCSRRQRRRQPLAVREAGVLLFGAIDQLLRVERLPVRRGALLRGVGRRNHEREHEVDEAEAARVTSVSSRNDDADDA